MNLFLAVFVAAVFAATIEFFNLPGRARETLTRSRNCLSVLTDRSATDDAKEEALRREARHLFRLMAILVGISAVALGLPLAVVWLLGKLGVGSFSGTLDVLESIEFLVGITVVGVIIYVIIRYLRSS